MAENADLDVLVHLLVTSLVEYPDDVKIEKKVNDDGTMFEVAVHGDDVGKIIGRQGRVIKAIRTLVRAAASINGSDAMVEVLG